MIGASMSHTAVVRYFDMPRSTVSNIVRRSKQATECRKKGNGRQPKLLERGMRKSIFYTEANRFKSLRSIGAGNNEFAHVKICTNTLKRNLHKFGIKRCTAVSKPFLSTKNMRAHIKRAENFQSRNDSQLKQVIFSDESSFIVRPNSLRKRV